MVTTLKLTIYFIIISYVFLHITQCETILINIHLRTTVHPKFNVKIPYLPQTLTLPDILKSII